LPNQAKLLRLLQEATYRALGCDHFTRANVRVIAATNRRIEDCVRQGQFRSDLYFRINVLRLQLPPLRERSGDISLLARHFLKHECANVERKEFSNRALRKLESYDWPGNVRELFNTVQRAIVCSVSRQILPEHLMLPDSELDFADDGKRCGLREAKQKVIASFERTYIEELLARHHGNMTQAALDAGKERRTFGRLAKKYNLAPFSEGQA
jgi:DNA-binding NtrC family response regulator